MIGCPIGAATRRAMDAAVSFDLAASLTELMQADAFIACRIGDQSISPAHPVAEAVWPAQ